MKIPLGTSRKGDLYRKPLSDGHGQKIEGDLSSFRDPRSRTVPGGVPPEFPPVGAQ
jgi:hypothetical protein